MTTLAVTSVSSLLRQVSTCLRIGSKLRCMRSMPTEMQSISENDFECFASTGVKSPANAMFEHTNTRYYPQQRIMRSLPVKPARSVVPRIRFLHINSEIPGCPQDLAV